MIEVILKSNTSGKVKISSYTARQLLEFCSEEDLIEDMTKCNCTQLHEYGYDPCYCDVEWEDYTLIIGNENNYNNIDYNEMGLPDIKKAFAIANNAIYFDDNSDYKTALYEVCEVLKQVPTDEIGKVYIEESDY